MTVGRPNAGLPMPGELHGEDGMSCRGRLVGAHAEDHAEARPIYRPSLTRRRLLPPAQPAPSRGRCDGGAAGRAASAEPPGRCRRPHAPPRPPAVKAHVCLRHLPGSRWSPLRLRGWTASLVPPSSSLACGARLQVELRSGEPYCIVDYGAADGGNSADLLARVVGRVRQAYGGGKVRRPRPAAGPPLLSAAGSVAQIWSPAQQATCPLPGRLFFRT